MRLGYGENNEVLNISGQQRELAVPSDSKCLYRLAFDTSKIKDISASYVQRRYSNLSTSVTTLAHVEDGFILQTAKPLSKFLSPDQSLPSPRDPSPLDPPQKSSLIIILTPYSTLLSQHCSTFSSSILLHIARHNPALPQHSSAISRSNRSGIAGLERTLPEHSGSVSRGRGPDVAGLEAALAEGSETVGASDLRGIFGGLGGTFDFGVA